MVLALSFARTPNGEFNFREKWNLRVLAFLALCNTLPPPVSLSFKPWFSRGAKDLAEIYLFVRLCRVLDTRDGGSVEEIAENVCSLENGEPYLPKRDYSRVCVRICAAKFAHIVEFLRRISRIIFRPNRGGPPCLRCRCKFIISFFFSSTERFNLWKMHEGEAGGRLFARGGKDDRLMIKNITLERRQ